MIRAYFFFTLGLCFILMAAGLFALTLRKPKQPAVVPPSKAQQRAEAALADEHRKMRIGAAVVATVGVALCALLFF